MAEIVTLTLHIPALVDRPAVGTSCCVTSADALIAQELWMLPGIGDIQVEADHGLVKLEYDPRRVSAEAIGTALGELGYPPVSTQAATEMRLGSAAEPGPAGRGVH